MSKEKGFATIINKLPDKRRFRFFFFFVRIEVLKLALGPVLPQVLDADPKIEKESLESK